MTVFDLEPQDTILATSDWLDAALKWGSVDKSGLKTRQAAEILLNANTPEEGVRLLQRVANKTHIAGDPNVPLDDEGTSILRPNSVVVRSPTNFNSQPNTYYFNTKGQGGVSVSTRRDNASGAILLDKIGQIHL
jgi:hypothetical protein